MEEKNRLLDNLDKIHATKLGIERIQRNLKIDSTDVVGFCIGQITDKDCQISSKGKNWSCQTGSIRITVNASSYTIITAHLLS